MNSVSVDQQIARIAATIGREYKPRQVILFGSYARGEPTKNSDIDLFIIKETTANRVDRFVQVKRIIYDPHLRIPVSPLVYTPEEVEKRLNMGDAFVQEIIREGKVLYEVDRKKTRQMLKIATEFVAKLRAGLRDQVNREI